MVKEQPEEQLMDRKHIFAVNKAPEFLDLVRDLLQDEHYNVTTTNFVPRTFEQIAGLQPDLLLIDLMIGQKAGWDLLERLQEEAITRNIPVIVISTDPSLLERAETNKKRFDGKYFIAKPFDIDNLLDAIRLLLAGEEPPKSAIH